METNGRRCGPLCQHPGCWQSDVKKPFRSKHPQYEKYVDQLLRQRCFPSKHRRHKVSENEGLPVLTVQTVALDADSRLSNVEHSTAPATNCSPQSLPQHHPQLHNVEVLLEPAKFSSSTSFSFSPVLIWRPGRHTHRPLAAGQSKPQENIAVKDLSDALPVERPTTADREKAKFNCRPHSRPDSSRPDSLDFLHDIPHYLVAEILHQLQSESSSTLSPSPLHQPHTSTNQSTAIRPDSCHIPHSLICDLSSGQIYRNTPTVPVTSSREASTPPAPTPPPPANESPDVKPNLKRKKRRVTLASMSKKTSFSRALSNAPMTILNKSGTLPQPSQPQLIHTTLLLPPNPPQQPQRHSSHRHSSHRHTSRYPLGNPVEPRTPQTHGLNPLLTPYPSPPSNLPQISNKFLHIFPADFHNTRLVTLHCSGNPPPPPDNHPAINEEPTPQIEDDGNTVHLPPIPLPSPPLPCVSPDHMNLGAEIVGDQLVLDRGSEHVVHPLTDPSHSIVSRPETTPPSGGVVNGTQAPPPTAS